MANPVGVVSPRTVAFGTSIGWQCITPTDAGQIYIYTTDCVGASAHSLPDHYIK